MGQQFIATILLNISQQKVINI